MIHCIGDSHSSVFSGNEEMQPIWPNRSNDITPYFKSYRLGPATAYQLENKKQLIDEVLVNVNDADIVLFCFGEVDIRAHLLKQSFLQFKPIEPIVKECVDRYINVVRHYKDIGYNVAVWGVIASWNDLKPYLGGPSFGSNIERNNVTKIFNDYLIKLCGVYDIPFISIFNEMINEDQTTNSIYLDDWEDCHIHLNQKAMPLIINAFKKKNLI